MATTTTTLSTIVAGDVIDVQNIRMLIVRIEQPRAALSTPRTRVTYTSWLGGEQVIILPAATPVEMVTTVDEAAAAAAEAEELAFLSTFDFAR